MLPLMTKNVNKEEKIIKNFDGINLTDDNSFVKMTDSLNMSSDKYPSLSAITGFEKVCEFKNEINGVFPYNGFVYTTFSESENKIFLNYEGEDYEFTSYSSSDDFSQKRKMASMGEKIFIIPDKVIFDTSKKEFQSAYLNETTTKETSAQRYSAQSGKTDILADDIEKVGRILNDRLTSLSTTYQSGKYEFYHVAFDPTLKVGDVVTIKAVAVSYKAEGGSEYTSFVNAWKKGYTFKIQDITKVKHSTPNGTIKESTCLYFGDSVVNTGGYSDAFFTDITVIRQVPDLEDICSFNNRIWGIGKNYIYASKLGDMSEWNDFSTDSFGVMPGASYKVSSQFEGDFSAIMTFGNFVCAISENSISKIYGDTPEDFKIYSQRVKGCKKENKDSCVFIKNSIIYPSGNDVYIYDGNLPKKINEKTGPLYSFKKAVTNGNTCYFLTENGEGNIIYTYDTQKDIWHKIDGSDFCDLCAYNDDVIVVKKSEVLKLGNPYKPDNAKDVFWSFTLRFDAKTFQKNVYGLLNIRYSLKKDAYFKVQTTFDDGSKGAICGASFDEKLYGSHMMNLSLKRCNYFELTFKGRGLFTLYSIGLKHFKGSEI